MQKVRENTDKQKKQAIARKKKTILDDVQEVISPDKVKMPDIRKYDLTKKEQLLVNEFLTDLNATQAAIRAGYSIKAARVTGSQVLSKHNIQRYLNDYFEAFVQNKGRQTQETVHQLRRIAFADVNDFLTYDNNNVVFKPSKEIDGSLIESIQMDEDEKGNRKVKIKFHSKIKALEMLCKYLNLWNDVTVKVDEVNLNDVKVIKNTLVIRKEDIGKYPESIQRRD